MQTDLTKSGSIWEKRNKFENLFLIQNYLQIPCWWCKLLNKQIRNPSNTTSTRQWWQHSLMYSPYSFYRWPCQLRHWEPAFPVNAVFPDTNSPLVNSLWQPFCAWSIWERWLAWYCQPLHQCYHRPELKWVWYFYKIKIFYIDVRTSKFECYILHKGGFHLHLLVFPFVYQFNSRIRVLVHLSFACKYLV